MSCMILVSCSEDFIEIGPESTVTTDVLYTTDNDFRDALIGTYNALQEPYGNFWKFSDLRGDDTGHFWQIPVDYILIDDFSMDVNDSMLNNTWMGYYNVIYSINNLLAEIQDADASIVTNKEQYIAEAKFLRALAYFDLVRIWGGVPMITSPVSIDESYGIGREDVETIYEEIIIRDLLEAENILPETYAAPGRATKGAAKALLGKVYLTRQNFTDAEAKLQEVTNMGYALLDNFNDLFDYENEHHSEYIFDIEYIDGGFGIGSPFTTQFMVETQTVGAPIVAALQNKYDIRVINSRSAGSPTESLINAFEVGDLRNEITVSRGVTDLNGNFLPLSENGIPSFTEKYMTSLIQEEDSKANWKVIRYADVLLMYAEALNENGKTFEAIEYLNRIRNRAGLEGYSTDLSQGEAREKIYLERRFELYLEGHRWFDLVRTERALEVMQASGKDMQSHHLLFPIPQRQLEVVNDPSVLTQNPGY